MTTATPTRASLKSHIYVSRTSERDIQFRTIDVFVDGILLGHLKYGETHKLDLVPGNHTIKVTNGMSTRTLDFPCSGGEGIHFQIGQSLPKAGIMFLIFLMMAPYQVFLEEIERDQEESADGDFLIGEEGRFF